MTAPQAALLEALNIGLAAAEAELATRKEALAGYPHKWAREEREVEIIRAAIAQAEAAQPSDQRCDIDGLRYKLPPLVMTGHQLRQALQFVQADDSRESLDTEVCLALRPGGLDTEGEKVEAGLCIWLAEYPEEGSLLLDGKPLHDAPAEAAQGEAQPVAWDWLRGVMDGIPTREERIGGQRQQYVAKEAVMGWIEEGQSRAKRAAPQPAEAARGEAQPVATVAEVHMSRYTLEWTSGPLPEGTNLYAAPQPAEAAPTADLATENTELRHLLAVRVAGALLYADDGELQDASELPAIDFKRDAPGEIARKLTDRGLKKLTKPERVHALVNAGAYPGMSEEFDAHMGAACWTDPAYRQDAAMWAAAWKAALSAAEAAPKQEAVADERAVFEAWMPRPDCVKWTGREYEVLDGYESLYRVERFCAAWSAWQARAALSAQPQQPAPRHGSVTVNGAVVCCEEFDRKPCPHDPAKRCATCPGAAQQPAPMPVAVDDLLMRERERLCAAIKTEDDYTVAQGDYMLDSDDCISVIRGTWKRPDFSVGSQTPAGEKL